MMTVSFYLAMLVYLTDGTPMPQMFILPVEVGCNYDVALHYARTHIPIPEGYTMQAPEAKMKWYCFAIETEAPGPAMKPILYPGLTEAAR